MRVTMMLADAAQEVNGKLYILGGGWSVTGPVLPPMAIALKLDVPWVAADQPHEFVLVLVDADGHPVRVGETQDEVRAGGRFEVARPEGLPPGADIDFSLALTIGSLPLPPGAYVWQLWIDDETSVDWQRPFLVRA
jgi:hypothetical protein